MTDEKRKQAGGTEEMHQVDGPAWVSEMRAYYQRNGFYRAKDLARVLGDPRDEVSVSFSDVPRAASYPPK